MTDRPADHIVFSELQVGKVYDIEDVCTVKAEKFNANNTTFVNTSYLHWYKSDRITFTPAQGVELTKIVMKCTAAAQCVPLPCNRGEVTVDTGNLTLTWTGQTTADTPLAFTATTGQERVAWMLVTYGAATLGIDDINADDNDAPVEYYSLQGIRLTAPIAGTVCLRRQGSRVSKVLVH